jgi:hypothetical protein
MKKGLILILSVLLVGFIVSCSGGGDDSPSMAALRVLCDPNPVDPAADGKFYFRVTLTEDNGIGVEITAWTAASYNADDSLRGINDLTADFAAWFDECGGSGTYIAGGTSRCANINYDGAAAYSILAFFGRDDLGNTVEGSGRVDFNNTRSKSPVDRISD